MQIQFFEAAGEEAVTRLRTFADELQGRGAELSLLRNEDQPGMLLLMVRGTDLELEAPSGVRHWRFREVGDAP